MTGIVDYQTSTAVLGFQKWANLTRDGALGAATVSALLRATRPAPALRHPAGGSRFSSVARWRS